MLNVMSDCGSSTTDVLTFSLATAVYLGQLACGSFALLLIELEMYDHR